MSNSALILKDIGKNFYLTKENVELEPPAPHEILVKVHAAGLNPIDSKLAQTGVPAWQNPIIPGLDGCGEVVETGSTVSRVRVGDNVAWHASLLTGGSLAEYIILPAHIVSIVPSAVDPIVAASIPCAGLTAWNVLKVRMNLRSGMSILIEAGSGGVGGFAIQIAKAMGLTVITTTSPANYDYVTELGADHVLNYAHPQLEQEIFKAAGNTKLDAVLDSIGDSVSARNIKLLKHEGQYASLLGVPHADEFDLFVASPTVYVIAIISSHLAQDYAAQCLLGEMGNQLLAEMASGAIVPLPIKEIPFTDNAVTKAMHLQLEGHVKGKQVVVIA